MWIQIFRFQVHLKWGISVQIFCQADPKHFMSLLGITLPSPYFSERERNLDRFWGLLVSLVPPKVCECRFCTAHFKQRPGSEKAALYKDVYTGRAAWPLTLGGVTIATAVEKGRAERDAYMWWAMHTCQDLPPTQHATKIHDTQSGQQTYLPRSLGSFSEKCRISVPTQLQGIKVYLLARSPHDL